jgi:hypothetical protein
MSSRRRLPSPASPGRLLPTGRSSTGTRIRCKERPPWQPFPEVVGITVHLTIADRAYSLAAWYRERSAKVILGGLHALSFPEEAAPHADALAIGDGVQVWPDILRDVEVGTLSATWRTHQGHPWLDR